MMVTFLLIVSLSFHLHADGYYFEGEHVVFIYPSNNADSEIFVSGNFNDWTKTDVNWKMKFNANASVFELKVPKERIQKKGQSFYEFSFVLDGHRLDADKTSENVIHCLGYGYRYTITFVQ